MINKSIKSLFVKSKKMVLSCVSVALLIVSLCVNAFAAAEDTSSVVAGVTSTFSSLQTTFSFTNIITMIGIALGAASLLTLGWFGLRKVVSMIQTALKKGRVKV